MQQANVPAPGVLRFPDGTWRKSSYSSPEGTCVEVNTEIDGVVGVRDSKEPGAMASIFAFSPQNWGSFVAGVKRGDVVPA